MRGVLAACVLAIAACAARPPDVTAPRVGTAPERAPAPDRTPATATVLVSGAGEEASADAGSDAAPADTSVIEVDPVQALLALDAAASTSSGAPGRGNLVGGVALPDAGPGFARNPRRPHAARFGSVELVQAIVRAAGIVDAELPGSGLVVNDLSLERGGPIAQHGSHQSGRDADILFYALDAKGKPLPAVGVPLDPSGSGWDFKDLAVPEDDVRVKLDPRRTWRFLQALLDVANEHVQRIFIAEHVRALLLAEADKRRAPARIVERFALVTCQPGTPHDDHMHVRFYCAPDDIAAGCEDSPPAYPWRRQALAALGIEPVLAKTASRRERDAVSERTTSPKQARAKAEAKAPLHRAVRRFLAEREAWLVQPHPGRPYCP